TRTSTRFPDRSGRGEILAVTRASAAICGSSSGNTAARSSGANSPACESLRKRFCSARKERARRLMRFTPKMKYATAPTSGTNHVKPTQSVAARESRLCNSACADANTESVSVSAATSQCQIFASSSSQFMKRMFPCYHAKNNRMRRVERQIWQSSVNLSLYGRTQSNIRAQSELKNQVRDNAQNESNVAAKALRRGEIEYRW